jgi:hypothetical protein
VFLDALHFTMQRPPRENSQNQEYERPLTTSATRSTASRNAAFDSPWTYLCVKFQNWFLPVLTLFVVLLVTRNYTEIVSWLEEVKEWEADFRRGPYHVHNRPRFDENGNPRRNPFVVIFGTMAEEDMLRFLDFIFVQLVFK